MLRNRYPGAVQFLSPSLKKGES